MQFRRERRSGSPRRDHALLTRVFSAKGMAGLEDIFELSVPERIQEQLRRIPPDHLEYGHSTGVAALSARIACKLAEMQRDNPSLFKGKDAEELMLLSADSGAWAYAMGRIHDIGKVSTEEMRELFLNNAGNWEDREDKEQLIRAKEKHAALSAKELYHSGLPPQIIDGVLFHHYPKGYPHGFDEIEHPPLGARILAVADSLHAMWTRQVGKAGGYIKRRSLREQMDDLLSKNGAHGYDPRVTEALLKLVREENNLFMRRVSRSRSLTSGIKHLPIRPGREPRDLP
ncbi:HD domain protein [Candidatus Norongarragalina meridionalis]|nr:HD domain protein [Candidatus Norongarragalina meridionalis]